MAFLLERYCEPLDLESSVSMLTRAQSEKRIMRQRLPLTAAESCVREAGLAMPIRLFISSVQKEFASECAALRDYLRGDALMRRFFEVFLFEDMPAADRRPDELYLDEVQHCDVYVGLFRNEYGFEDKSGASPTEREFDAATANRKYRLIYVKGTDEAGRHAKMRFLISKAQGELVRKRFGTAAELLAGLYTALIAYLERRGLIRHGPFHAARSLRATLDDLDAQKMAWFVGVARGTRRIPLPGDIASSELLRHLSLLDHGVPTNAALLLFGGQPQRFLISSEVKCGPHRNYTSNGSVQVMLFADRLEIWNPGACRQR